MVKSIAVGAIDPRLFDRRANEHRGSARSSSPGVLHSERTDVRIGLSRGSTRLMGGQNMLFADGNPVTGTGYASEPLKNGPTMQNGTISSNSSSGEKSTDSSPTAKPAARTRVPPGGYSSGLW